MGVTIRHLTKLMSEVDARTRLLVTLSDGKPDDYDGYRYRAGGGYTDTARTIRPDSLRGRQSRELAGDRRNEYYRTRRSYRYYR